MLAMVPEQQFCTTSISTFFYIKLEERDCIFHASLEGSKSQGKLYNEHKDYMIVCKETHWNGLACHQLQKKRDEASEMLQPCKKSQRGTTLALKCSVDVDLQCRPLLYDFPML